MRVVGGRGYKREGEGAETLIILCYELSLIPGRPHHKT